MNDFQPKTLVEIDAFKAHLERMRKLLSESDRLHPSMRKHVWARRLAVLLFLAAAVLGWRAGEGAVASINSIAALAVAIGAEHSWGKWLAMRADMRSTIAKLERSLKGAQQ